MTVQFLRRRKTARFAVLTLLAALLFTLFPAMPVAAVNFIPNCDVYSEAVLLVNLDNNVVLYEQNADKPMFPASLTKIMTAILALENISDLDNTMIEANPALFDELYLSGASTANFLPYEVASAKDLMYGMVMQSACEAASILAYHVGGGSVTSFVQMMNDKAAELGCTNTHFANAHGLFDESQHTTARDMALITQYAISLPRFMDIANTVQHTIPVSNKNLEPRTVRHTVKMLDKNSEYYYSPLRGVKTGTLDESGRCLITTATKDGYNYLLVTLNAPQETAPDGKVVRYDFQDHRNLYQWAFDDFRYTTLLSADEEVDEVPVKFSSGNDYVLVSPASDYATLWQTSIDQTNLRRVVTLDEEVIAPVEKGQKLGTIELQLSGEAIVSVDLIATASVERSAWKYNLDLAKQFTSSAWFKIAVVVAVALVIGYLALYISSLRRQRRKKRRVKKSRRF